MAINIDPPHFPMGDDGKVPHGERGERGPRGGDVTAQNAAPNCCAVSRCVGPRHGAHAGNHPPLADVAPPQRTCRQSMQGARRYRLPRSVWT
eukprot:gene11706-24456_t